MAFSSASSSRHRMRRTEWWWTRVVSHRRRSAAVTMGLSVAPPASVWRPSGSDTAEGGVEDDDDGPRHPKMRAPACFLAVPPSSSYTISGPRFSSFPPSLIIPSLSFRLILTTPPPSLPACPPPLPSSTFLMSPVPNGPRRYRPLNWSGTGGVWYASSCSSSSLEMSVDSQSGSMGAKGSNVLDLDVNFPFLDFDLLVLLSLAESLLPLAAESRLRWL